MTALLSLCALLFCLLVYTEFVLTLKQFYVTKNKSWLAHCYEQSLPALRLLSTQRSLRSTLPPDPLWGDTTRNSQGEGITVLPENRLFRTPSMTRSKVRP